MFEPCYQHCYLRYGKKYTKECDLKCNYAKAVKESKNKDRIIKKLLDMLEEEKIELRAKALREMENILLDAMRR